VPYTKDCLEDEINANHLVQIVGWDVLEVGAAQVEVYVVLNNM
jgi:hypothetical protein